jgi:glycosyltransferase involved in cell wall biosynthesis
VVREAVNGHRRLRIAVYDRYWSTGGGGEKYAGGVAEVLNEDHDVTLIGHEPIDTGWLGERLNLDLDGVATLVVDECDSLESVTAGFDVLINLSYRSHARNGAARGIYIVHFPDRPGADLRPWQRFLRSKLLRLSRTDRRMITVQSGFHEADTIRWQEVRWTNGAGVLDVDVPAGAEKRLQLRFGRFIPGGIDRTISVEVDGVVLATDVLRCARNRFEVIEPLLISVPVIGRVGSNRVVIRSESGSPAGILGNGDNRILGVPLVSASFSRGPVGAAVSRASLLTAAPAGTDWLQSYDLVMANSEFTRTWIQRWWGIDSVVLEPPVALRVSGPKTPMILSVGRFFAPGRGHAKKQLELVRAFGALGKVADGWELHLAGGCSPEDEAYLDEVKSEATGLAVVFHVNASGSELDGLYRRASIYWHATGLGEDLDHDPVRAEHFGITTVEAMSAGAVPVVINAGGQPEIVRSGVDGYLFDTPEELVRFTSDVISDPVLRSAMGESSIERAKRFGMANFGARLKALVDDAGAAGPTRH